MPSSSVSTETPFHLVSSLLQFVTQWMSTVTSSAGSAVNSSHVHERDSSTAPWIENVHSSSGVRGVGLRRQDREAALVVTDPAGSATDRRRRGGARRSHER